MTSKEYVFNHDFGYCKMPANKKVNKISLRNIADLNTYMSDVISCNVNCNLNGLILEFDDNDNIFKIVVQKCTKIN